MSERPLRVAVIGAGMAGILSAIKLREAGIDDFTVYEKADRLGGTWRENTYPGIACDVPSHLYCYSFALNPDWSHRYSPGGEIQTYFERVAREHGVERDMRFGDAVARLAYTGGRWRLTTEAGHTDEVDVVIAATGVLHQPNVPAIAGMDEFAGAIFHSARWDHDVVLDGARIGVIGTGSTAIQITSAVVDRAQHYSLFQRTPQWVLPSENPAYTDEEKEHLRSHPEALDQLHGEISEIFAEGFSNAVIDAESPMMKMIEQACRDNLEQSVTDPDLRERLRPDDVAACKRLIISPDFYQAIQRPDAELVTDPIRCIEAGGVRTVDGRLHDLDVLVLATGFDANTGGLTSIDLRGSDGRTIAEHWADGVDTHLGLAAHGFPNMLMLYGPQSTTAYCNGPVCAEIQGDWVAALLDHMRRNDLSTFESSEESGESWSALLAMVAEQTLFGRTDSWYMAANIPGKRRQLMNLPMTDLYLERLDSCAADGYDGFEFA